MSGSYPTARLGEIVSFRGGGTPSKGVGAYWNGNIPWVSPKDMKSDHIGNSIDKITPEAIQNSAASLIPTGSLLIVVRSGILARTVPVASITRDLAVNQDIKALVPTDRIDRRYLHYFLWSAEPALLSLVTRGATVHRLSTDTIKNLAVPLPPLPEQKRIVAILDEAFEGIGRAVANAEKNLANAREMFESYLNAVFMEKGEGWAESPLSELVEIKHGFAFKSEFFEPSGNFVLLTPGNFYEEGGYRDRGEKQKFYKGEIPDGYVLRKGDFLIAMTEQAAGLLGSSLIVPEDGKFLHNQRLGLVQVRPRVPWESKFFFHAFNTRSFRHAVHDGASGVKVRHTSPRKLGEVRVAYPTDVIEQARIAVDLSHLRERSKMLAELYITKLGQLADLKQSILQKAFAGELTKQPDRALAMAGA